MTTTVEFLRHSAVHAAPHTLRCCGCHQRELGRMLRNTSFVFCVEKQARGTEASVIPDVRTRRFCPRGNDLRPFNSRPERPLACTNDPKKKGEGDCSRNVGSEEPVVVLSELEILQRDIDGLLDTNRLDWLALANEPMSSEQRIEVRKAIAARNVDLLELLQRKWALEEVGDDQRNANPRAQCLLLRMKRTQSYEMAWLPSVLRGP